MEPCYIRNYIDPEEIDIVWPNLEDKLKSIDALINCATKKLQTVGTAVGIVVEGKTVFTNGYGLRDYADKNSHVTPDTVFAIGSCTKAFTAYAIDHLNKVEGVLNWNDKVITKIPEFRLNDVQRSHDINVKDLMTHSSGLPAHMMSMYNAKVPRDELIARLPFLEPNYGLREKYQYSNLMVTVAGIVTERVTGQSWEDVIRTRIFEPLGMKRSFAALQELVENQVKDVAKPHKIGPDSSVTSIPFQNISNLAPSGSIMSSITDMTKWTQRQLNLSGSSQQMHYPQMALSTEPVDGEIIAYGMGWMLSTYHGRIMVYHTGSVLGQVSQVTMFPNHKLGIVVLTNLDSLAGFIVNLTNRIVDILTDHACVQKVDNEAWISKQVEKSTSAGGQVASSKSPKKSEAEMKVDNAEQYVGHFVNPGYGSVEISSTGSQLFATYNSVRYALKPKENRDVFSAHSDFPNEFVFEGAFVRDETGAVSGYRFHLEPQVPSILFEKKISAEIDSVGYLKSFVGTYVRNTTSVEIVVNATQHILMASGPSQLAVSLYSGELRPFKKNWFQSKRSAGTQFEFTLSGNVVSGINVHVGENVYPFQKKEVQ